MLKRSAIVPQGNPEIISFLPNSKDVFHQILQYFSSKGSSLPILQKQMKKMKNSKKKMA
jgi:hypothetical protein